MRELDCHACDCTGQTGLLHKAEIRIGAAEKRRPPSIPDREELKWLQQV